MPPAGRHYAPRSPHWRTIPIGLGVRIDYSLFILTRTRTGLRRGLSVEEAVTAAADAVGRDVLFAAQYPVLLPGTAVTLTSAGAPHATLVAIIWLFVVAVVLVGPAFALPFSLQGRSLLYAEDAQIALAGVPGSRTRPPAGPPGQQPASGSPGSSSRAAALGLVAVGALVRALGRRRGR
jgi:hypothetical protein